MNNLIKSRRGIAIEIAIGAMFVMIALSIVLLSISGMQSAQGNRDLAEFQEKIDMYELTDKVLAKKITFPEGSKSTEFVAEDGNKYIISYDTEIRNEIEYTDYVIKKQLNDEDNTETVVLTFTVDNNNKITSWGK